MLNHMKKQKQRLNVKEKVIPGQESLYPHRVMKHDTATNLDTHLRSFLSA